MSTQQNNYVIYGLSLKWENTDHIDSKFNSGEKTIWDVFNEYSDSAFKVAKKDSLLILDDGRDGNHLIIGICLASTENYQGFDNPIECSVNLKQKKNLKKFIEELESKLPIYYNFKERINGLKPKVYAVTHYR